MNDIDWKKFTFVDYLNCEDNEVKNLPPGVNISTMCGNCKLNTKFNITNIEHYLPLNKNDIISVKVSNDRMRTLIKPKIKKRRTKKNTVVKTTSNPFYNQITVVVRIKEGEYEDLAQEKKINLKLFKNGTIQISGLKNVKYCNRAINKLLLRLKQSKAIKENENITEIKFIEDIDDELSISNFNIYMINSNYKIQYHINRAALYKLLIMKKIKCSYEKTIRACVIVKYVPEINNEEEKEISIFIFEKGNIIITGARNLDHIGCSYKYINNILLNHIDEIIMSNSEENDKLIFELYTKIITDEKHKLKNI